VIAAQLQPFGAVPLSPRPRSRYRALVSPQSAEPALEPGATAATSKASSQAARGRYRVLPDGGIVCGNATNVVLRVERGLTVDRRGRKRYPPQTIFLDGVYAGAPFCDNGRRHYSLDHHADCVRAFTLATCEQAVVMLLQGLPLGIGDWTLYVNDPDLDSVLAAWVLMNHADLLASERALLHAIMPLVRLEGVIDAHGTDMELFAALPDELLRQTRALIGQLMKRERELKGEGQWFHTDWVAYTREQLMRLDKLLLSKERLAALLAVQEGSRVSLGDRFAVLLRSNNGIYEVEARLKERYGQQLGMVVLDQGEGRFTLRQVDSFLKKDLEQVYKVLNRHDPNARPGDDPPNVWGGSGNIGGAPRATGSALDGDEILAIIAEVVGPRPNLLARIWRWLRRNGNSPRGPRALPPKTPEE